MTVTAPNVAQAGPRTPFDYKRLGMKAHVFIGLGMIVIGFVLSALAFDAAHSDALGAIAMVMGLVFGLALIFTRAYQADTNQEREGFKAFNAWAGAKYNLTFTQHEVSKLRVRKDNVKFGQVTILRNSKPITIQLVGENLDWKLYEVDNLTQKLTELS